MERIARRMLPLMLYDYVAGGAHDEWTLDRNRSQLDRWALLPRVLRDVSHRSTSTRILGNDHTLPVLMAPTGLSGALWPDGEEEVARAAVGRGLSMMVSAAAVHGLEPIAEASGDPSRLAFQLFVYRDRRFTEDLVMRAADAGYGALVVTVDVPMTGRRVRDHRNGFTIPPSLRLRPALDMARVLTPDSSRFWPADSWQPGQPQYAMDKQVARDWASGLDWDKTEPGPAIPDDVVAAIQDRYADVYGRITGERWTF